MEQPWCGHAFTSTLELASIWGSSGFQLLVQTAPCGVRALDRCVPAPVAELDFLRRLPPGKLCRAFGTECARATSASVEDKGGTHETYSQGE